LVQIKRKRKVRKKKKQNQRKLVFLLLFAEECIVGRKGFMLKIRQKNDRNNGKHELFARRRQSGFS
jgi:hypothetical protein